MKQWLSFIFLLLSACSIGLPEDQDLEELYSIPFVNLKVDAETLGELNSEVFSGKRYSVTLQYGGNEYEVKIRNQGGLARQGTKRNYLIEMDEGFVTISSSNRISNFILSGQWTDNTLMRNVLAAEIYEAAGLEVFEQSYISFFLNGNYTGLYLMIEVVDQDFFLRRGIETECFYKVRYSTLSANHYTSVEKQFDRFPDEPYYGDIAELIDVLDQAPASQLSEKLEPLIDVTNFLNYISATFVVGNIDNAERNYYLYHEKNGKLKILPWDLDYTFLYYDYPLVISNQLNRLLEVEDYYSYTTNQIQVLLSGEFSRAQMTLKTDNLTNRFYEAYLNDPFAIASGWDLQESPGFILSFCVARKNFMDDEIFD